MAISASLATLCPITLTGGKLRPQRMDLCGIAAYQSIERYRFTKAILGADGITADGNVSSADEETSLLSATVVKHSQAVLILADSGKLGRMLFVPYTQISGERFTLITDTGASAEILDALRALKIRLVLVNPDGEPEK